WRCAASKSERACTRCTGAKARRQSGRKADMPGLVDFLVTRANILDRLRLVSRRYKGDRDEARQLPREVGWQDLADRALRYGITTKGADDDHFRNDWLGESGHPYWPGLNVEGVLRKSMYEIVGVLAGVPREIEGFWSYSAGNTDITVNFSTSPGSDVLVME